MVYTLKGVYKGGTSYPIIGKANKDGTTYNLIKAYKNGTEYLFKEPSVTYGVSINTASSDPLASVTYTDDAVGMTAGAVAWDSKDIFKDIKPCLLKNGVRVGYLNKSNYAQWEAGQGLSGTPDITSGSAGDVMVEFPKVGWKFTTSGNNLLVQITNDPGRGSEGFRYLAHTRVTEGDRDYLYVGAYIGTVVSNALRSLSGKTCTASQTIGTFRTYAQANGSGYDQQHFYAITLMQILYLIKYKSLNCQTALGRGYVDGNSAAITTGNTNAKGFHFGETTGKLQCKCLGIEDLWGNVYTWVDGIFSDASRNILTAFQNFNNTGSGYTNRGASGHASNFNNYIVKVMGTSEAGFIAAPGTGGSETTYFCDYGGVAASRLAVFGGSWGYAGYAGVFCLPVAYAASNSYAHFGSRLMYL